MSQSSPVLHLLCGKIAAGKSTLAADLARASAHVLISEDAWLGALFSDEMQSGADYLRYSTRLRNVMGPHVVTLLEAGLSVVLDFPANTVAQRRGLHGLAVEAGVAHQLHFLDVDDEICLSRLRDRNAEGKHDFTATEAQFRTFTQHFAAPRPEEGLTIIRH